MTPFKCRFRKHGGEGNTSTLQSGVKYIKRLFSETHVGANGEFQTHAHTHSFSHFFSCYQKDSLSLNVQTKLSFLAQNLLLTSNTQRIKSNLSLHHTLPYVISSNHPLVLAGLLLFQQLLSPC